MVLSDDQECDALARLKYKRNRVPQGAQDAEVTRRAFAPPNQARHEDTNVPAGAIRPWKVIPP